MPYVVLVALALLGAVYVGSGIALLARRRSRLSGGLLALTGAGTIATTVVDATSRADAAAAMLVVCELVGVLAVVVYPSVSWRNAVDLVAVTIVSACPLLYLAGVLVGERTADWLGPDELRTASLSTAIVFVWWRIERATGSTRVALTWLAVGSGTPLLVGGAVAFYASSPYAAMVAVLLFALVGPAMYLGGVNPDVMDVRGLVVRFTEIGTAVLAYIALFGTVTAFLTLLGERPPDTGVLACVGALCAIGFHPLRILLRGVLDQILFGSRPDPLRAASDVVGSGGNDPATALDAIRGALVLPYVAVHDGDQRLAASGTPVTHTRRIALDLGPGSSGALEVGLRAGDLALTADDEQVLRLAAPLLAQTIRSHRLATEVQASREAVVAAREEERRRIRRDLHDGLGPRLSGIAFRSDAVGNLLRSDPEKAAEHLAQLRADTAEAIDDIRALVYAMRPPALDELGLVAAVRQQTGVLRTPDGARFDVTLTARDLPRLSAAAEVAAYRIAVEAATNAARHSGARSATLELGTENGALVVRVHDEGRRGTWSPGVGISSMRERAAELGGTLVAGDGEVCARLPLEPRP